MATQTNRQFAVITGASSGIAFELAKQCLAHAMDVLICAEDAALSQRAAELHAIGKGSVEAMAKSKDSVLGGGFTSRMEGFMNELLPETVKAKQAGKTTKPGSAKH